MRAIRIGCIAEFAEGTGAHLFDVVNGGQHAYRGFPLPSRILFHLLLILDPLTAYAVRRRRPWGPVLAYGVMLAGLLPPVEIDGVHYLDGGLVDSVPHGRAVQLGARRVFILHAGLVEKPLTAPEQPWEVASVVFEIARRHRLTRAVADLAEGVAAHLME